jgi:hypothetical protein
MTFHKASSSIAKTVMTHKCRLFTTPSCSPIRPVRILKGDPGGYSARSPRSYSGFAIESRYNKV